MPTSRYNIDLDKIGREEYDASKFRPMHGLVLTPVLRPEGADKKMDYCPFLRGYRTWISYCCSRIVLRAFGHYGIMKTQTLYKQDLLTRENAKVLLTYTARCLSNHRRSACHRSRICRIAPGRQPKRTPLMLRRCLSEAG